MRRYKPTTSVERWFGIITQKAIRRGNFSSVKELIEKIEQFVVTYDKTKASFNWGLLKNISRSRFESSRRTGVKAGRNRGYAVTSDSAISSGTIFLRATKSQPTG